MPEREGLVDGLLELDVTLTKLERSILETQIAGVVSQEPFPGFFEQAELRNVNRSGELADQVTGLRLTGNLAGSITVEWSPTTNSDVEFYEVWVATDANFVDVVEVTPVGNKTRYEFTDGTAGLEYFIRVRAKTALGFGIFSSAVSSLTGELFPNQLAVGSTGALISVVQTSFTPSDIGSGFPDDVGEYGFLEIETQGGVVVALASLDMDYSVSGPPNEYHVRLKEDGVVLVDTAFIDSSGSSGVAFTPALAVPSAPPEGPHVYSLEIERVSGTLSITPNVLRFDLFEIIR